MKNKNIVVLITILIVFSSALSSAYPHRTGYSKQEIVFDNLDHPEIMAKDILGWIYYVEGLYSHTQSIKKFNPYTKEIKTLITLDNAEISLVTVDIFLNVYFVNGSQFGPDQLYVLKRNGVLQELYSTNDVITYFVTDIFGNLYFIESRNIYQEEQFSKLVKVYRNGSIVTLVNFPGYTLTHMAYHPTLGIFMSGYSSNDTKIFLYNHGKLNVILSKPREKHGLIGYITVKNNRLYYLYRQSSDLYTNNYWGYLELGMFRFIDILLGKGPKILFNKTYDCIVAVWFRSYGFFGANRQGDLFATIAFHKSPDNLEIINVTLLYFPHYNYSDYKVLCKSKILNWDFLSFTFDNRENLYYSMTGSGKIIEVKK